MIGKSSNENVCIVLLAFFLAPFICGCGQQENEELLPIQPRLIELSFHYVDNPLYLVEDISCDIQGDSLVLCRIPYVVIEKHLIPRFLFEGSRVEADGKTIESGRSAVDFSHPVKLSVEASGGSKKWYTVKIQTFTGLPVLWLTTMNHQAVTSKEEYVNGHLRLFDDLCEFSEDRVTECDLQVKGRGNTNWQMPKKPYRLKLGEKKNLLGMGKDKSWVLQTNYLDQTMLRTATAFFLGYKSNLDYTPKYRFVELMLNGRYNGTYQLIEKLKISKERVNVGDDGFLLEIDENFKDGDVAFRTDHLLYAPINIKEPDDISIGDDNYLYVERFVKEFEQALFSDDFKDPIIGYRKYIDVPSFVDWYIIEDLFGNCDASLRTSCYIHLKRGGKLIMGPLWDFDLCLGSDGLEVDRFNVMKSTWFSRLLEDPYFIDMAINRLGYFYSIRNDIYSEIDKNATYLKYAVVENNNKWPTWYNYPFEGFKDTSLEIWGSYQNEVQNMKNWLDRRFVLFNDILVQKSKMN